MSIFSIARAVSNLFLLITHNFGVILPTVQSAPGCVFVKRERENEDERTRVNIQLSGVYFQNENNIMVYF